MTRRATDSEGKPGSRLGLRTISSIALSALVATLVVGGFAGAASAADDSAELLAHGPGTTFAGAGDYFSQTVSAGSAATFAVDVKNTGAVGAQFELELETVGSVGSTYPTQALTQGSLNVTALATSPTHYFTAPIAAGASQAYTLKVTPASSAVAGDRFQSDIFLFDTSGNLIDYEALWVNITSAKGTGSYDEFVTGSGQKSTGWSNNNEADNSYTFVTDPSVKVGGKSTYSVKLQNDSTSNSLIGYRLAPFDDCSSFSTSVKAGTTDVTAEAEAGTYVTPTLAPGKSTTLTVTVTLNESGGCSQLVLDSVALSFGEGQSQNIYLVAHAATS
jgi:hypothetical protein